MLNRINTSNLRGKLGLGLFWLAACVPLCLLQPCVSAADFNERRVSGHAQDNTVPACAAASDADVQSINFASIVEREISGGQRHFYKFELTAGAYLHATVNQKGIDLRVSVCGPNGELVAEVDRPNGSQGPEGISLIAERSGTFLLRVRPNGKRSPAARYEVRVEEPRAPVAEDNTRIKAEKAITQGEILWSSGNIEKIKDSIEVLRNAQTLWHSLNNRYEEALAFFDLGWAYKQIGSYGMVKFPQPMHRIRWSYDSREDLINSIENFTQALAIMNGLGDRYGQAIVYSGRAWPNLYLGKNVEALNDFTNAYELFKSLNNARGQGIALYGVGWINALEGDNAKALDKFLQALPLRQQAKDVLGEAITLEAIGKIYSRMGRNPEALDHSDRALRLFEELKDKHGIGSTLSVKSWVYYSLKQYDRALEAFQKTLKVREEEGDSTGIAHTHYGLARIYTDQGKLSDALKEMSTVLSIIDPLRDKGSTEELRTYYFASVQEYYEFYIDLLMRLDRLHPEAGHANAALEISEHARARELLAILAETAVVRSQWSALPRARPLKATEIQALLDEDTLLLEYALGEERSYLWAVSSKAIQSYSLPRRAEIEAMAQQLYRLMTARNNYKNETAAQKKLRLMHEDAAVDSVASGLSSILLGQAALDFKGKRLVIVAQGALQFVPFGALPVPSSASQPNKAQRPLLEDHEIVSLPSASILSILRRDIDSRNSSLKTIAVVADPVFEKDDLRIRRQAAGSTVRRINSQKQVSQVRNLTSPKETAADGAHAIGEARNLRRLPGTRWEAQEIVSLAPKGEGLLLLDFDANLKNVLDGKLSQYRYIHFATHAFVDNTKPALSKIVLSQVNELGRPQPGLLTVQDVYKLTLMGDLVVLSACETGFGVDVKGEGLIGLTGGFMHAGVPRVMVSLWPIDDRATADFMVRFYKKVLGLQRMSPAAALRETQLEMWRNNRWQSAYYWAPFVLQGEWRPSGRDVK